MKAILQFVAEGGRAALLLALLAAVRGYQVFVSPLLPNTCRFRPTCSQYSVIALRRYGPFAGSWKTLRRILRCHPWNPGGWDPP